MGDGVIVRLVRRAAIAALVLLCAACVARTPGVVAPEPAGGESSLVREMLGGDLGRAWALYGRGRHAEALIEFRKVKDGAESSEDREEARYGVAKCLVKMEYFAQAVEVLGPFSPSPQTDTARRRLALAGQAMLLDERPADAETLLEIALAGRDEPGEPPAWLGPCSANLGCAYLRNGKPAKAMTMYERAAGLFRRSGRTDAAAKAEEMARSLKEAL